MDTTVTVSVKSVLLAALVTLALVAAYLLGGRGEPVGSPAEAAAPAAPAPEEKPRTMRMVGTGEATAVPDQLAFTLSVTEKRTDLDDALAAASGTLRKALAGLAKHGVDRRDVQTTGLSMNPEYDYHASAPPMLTGYRVTQRARVLVTELAEGGQAIAAAIEAGGNGVRAGDIRLQMGDPDSVIARARERAVDSATAKARQYAEATGQQLGQVLRLREVSRNVPRSSYRTQLGGLVYSSADAAMAVPIRAGKDDLSVRIAVVWAFE